ncbi:MAG TPA: WD40 repeat domain-containing protein [Pyrinomonadaceae bacterium]
MSALLFVLGLCATSMMLGPVQPVLAQRMSAANRERAVFAVSLSPDGKTLAIARGTNSTSTRFSRVELWNVADGSLRHTIRGFDGQVWSVSFSPDGTTIVTGSSEFRSNKIREKDRRRASLVELKWWDAMTGELKRKVTLPDNNRMSLIATYSPDGRFVATVESYIDSMAPILFRPYGGLYRPRFTSASQLKLFDAKSGQLIFKLKNSFETEMGIIPRGAFRNRLRSEHFFASSFLQRSQAQFSSDSRYIAGWTAKEIRVWELGTGKLIHTIKSFKDRLSAVGFSPDGRSLAAAVSNDFADEESAGTSSEVRFYQILDGKLLKTIPVKTNVISSLVFVPNGQQMILGGLHKNDQTFVGAVELIDLTKGSVGRLAIIDNQTVRSLAISADSSQLALQLGGFGVETRNTQTWAVGHTYLETSDDNERNSPSRYVVSVKSVLSLGFSADGKTVAGELEEGGVKQWDVRTGETKKHLRKGNEAPLMVAFSANGESMVELAADKTLHIWDLAQGTSRPIRTATNDGISAVAIADDGETVAIASGDELILLSSAGTQSERTTVLETEEVNTLSFSADGRIVAVGSEAGDVRIVDVASNTKISGFNVGEGLTTVRFNPGSETLASAGADGSVALWDTKTGALRMRLRKHESLINALAFSPNGEFLASGGDDRSIVLWELSTGKSKRTLKGHDVTVSSLAFSPTGDLLASGTGNASVVLWDVRTGKLDRVLK